MLCASETVRCETPSSKAPKQKLYPKGVECTEKQAITYAQPAKIIVSPKRTLEAAMPYAYAGKSLHPQLCFCGKSGRWCDERFFGTGRGNLPLLHTVSESQRRNPLEGVLCAPPPPAEPLHNDDCIYTPGVIAFKSDTTYPKLLPEDKWCSVNVLTCAAPNLRERPVIV